MATISFRFLDNPFTQASASLKAEIWRENTVHAVQLTPQTRIVPITERAHHADPQRETDEPDDETRLQEEFTVTFTSIAPGGDPVSVRLPSPSEWDDTLFTVALYSVQPECEARPNRLVVRLFASFALTWLEAGIVFARQEKSCDVVLVSAVDDEQHGWATVTLDRKKIKRPSGSSREEQLKNDTDAGISVAETNKLVLEWCEREQSRFLSTARNVCGSPLLRRLLGYPHLCSSLDAVWGATGASWGDGGPPRFTVRWYYAQIDRELLIRGRTWEVFADAHLEGEANAAKREAARREATLVLAGAIARWSATRRYVRDWRGDGFVCSAGDRGDCTQAAWTSYHAWLGVLEFPDKSLIGLQIRNVAIWTGIPCLAYGKAKCASDAPLESHCWCVIVPASYFARAIAPAGSVRRATLVERVTILDGAIGTTPDFAVQSTGHKDILRSLKWIAPDLGKIETQLDNSVVKTYECVSRLVTRMFPGTPLPLGSSKALPRGEERRAYSFVPEYKEQYGVEFASLLSATLRHLPRADAGAERRISRFDRPIVPIDDRRDESLVLQNRAAKGIKGRVVVTLWRHRLKESFERLKTYAVTLLGERGVTIVEHHSCVVFALEW